MDNNMHFMKFIIKFILYALVLILFPFYFLSTVSQLIKNINKIKSTNIIVMMSGLGFGNSIQGIDIMRRFYNNKNPLFVIIGWGYNNPYVVNLWGETNVVYIKSFLGKKLINSKYLSFVNSLIINVIKNILVFIIESITKNKIIELMELYKESISVSENGLNAINKYIDIYPNYNGFVFVPWYYLIKNVKVDKATLPENYKALIESKLNKYLLKCGDKNSNKLCCLYIRAKGEKSKNITSIMRDGTQIETYLPIMKRLIDEGYIILLTGDRKLDKKYISKFNNKVISSEFLKVNSDIYFLFAATEADIFIGNDGGGSQLPIVNNIPSLIINAFPVDGPGFVNASILFKTIYDNKGELVDYKKLFEHYPYDYNINDYKIYNNTPEEMDLAVKYFLYDIKQNCLNKNKDSIMSSIPNHLLIKYTNSTISKAWPNLKFENQNN